VQQIGLGILDYARRKRIADFQVVATFKKFEEALRMFLLLVGGFQKHILNLHKAIFLAWEGKISDNDYGPETHRQKKSAGFFQYGYL
jgi:hypothetical protein